MDFKFLPESFCKDPRRLCLEGHHNTLVTCLLCGKVKIGFSKYRVSQISIWFSIWETRWSLLWGSTDKLYTAFVGVEFTTFTESTHSIKKRYILMEKKWKNNCYHSSLSSGFDVPRKSIIFKCLLLIPTTKHLGWLINQARECAVSETPASAIGLADSACVLLWWWEPDGLFRTSHSKTEWSVLYLSNPETIKFGSIGFHATALHCLACLGASQIIVEISLRVEWM